MHGEPADAVETLFKLALSFENFHYYCFNVSVGVWGVAVSTWVCVWCRFERTELGGESGVKQT